MARRKKLTSRGSKRLFRKTGAASNVHPKNAAPRPMRGGIRL